PSPPPRGPGAGPRSAPPPAVAPGSADLDATNDFSCLRVGPRARSGPSVSPARHRERGDEERPALGREEEEPSVVDVLDDAAGEREPDAPPSLLGGHPRLEQGRPHRGSDPRAVVLDGDCHPARRLPLRAHLDGAAP